MQINPNIGMDTLKGAAIHALGEAVGVVHVVTAGEVTAGKVILNLSAEPAAVEVLVFSAVATKRAWDGAVAVDGTEVTVDNTGSTDFVAGDKVVIRAYF